MQDTISNPSYHLTPIDILWGLMQREQAPWALTLTGSSTYPTKPDALHYVIDLNGFRMRDVDNIIVFGLRDLGTVDQLRANYDNQGLTADQQRTQNVAITQLQMARMIRDYIQANLRNQAAVNLYVCDQGFTQNIKWVLQQAQFIVFGRDELPRHINQNTLVYDVTMRAGELQRAFNLSWEGNTTPPAAVITHMSSLSPRGPCDANLLGNYWLSPLLETKQPLIVSGEMSQAMRMGPDTHLPYEKWAYLQEKHSLAVLRGYFEEAAAHSRATARYQDHVADVASYGGIPEAPPPLPKDSWVSDPMMIVLCRKDRPRPLLIVPDPQQQQPEYHSGEENRGLGKFGGAGESEGTEGSEGEDEFEEAAGHGGSSNVGYASMPQPYGPGMFGDYGGGPSQFLNVQDDDPRHRIWVRREP